MKEKIEQVRLADIVLDYSIRTRDVDEITVNAYRERLRADEMPPPLGLERGTNRLVKGHHRYTAYRKELEPTETVSCIFKSYATELELLEDAVLDNKDHGRPLSPWDKKCILVKLRECGAGDERIAGLFGVRISKLETWAGMNVVVIGEPSPQPIKHGMEHLIDGPPLSKEQYQRWVIQGTGVHAQRHASALIHILKDRGVDEGDEKTIVEFVKLEKLLAEFLRERGLSLEEAV